MKPPPSRAEWALDGEFNGGHTVAETIAWHDWCEEYAERLTERPRGPVVDLSWLWWRLRHRRRR